MRDIEMAVAVKNLRDLVDRRRREFAGKEAIFARARKMAQAEGRDFYEVLRTLGKRGGRKAGAIRRAQAPKVPFSESEAERARQVAIMEKRGLW